MGGWNCGQGLHEHTELTIQWFGTKDMFIKQQATPRDTEQRVAG